MKVMKSNWQGPIGGDSDKDAPVPVVQQPLLDLKSALIRKQELKTALILKQEIPNGCQFIKDIKCVANGETTTCMT